MSKSRRTVLITGCSDGGMGAELAKEFHKAGHHVIATARDVAKMSALAAAGIELLPLDVLSETSIADCVKKVKSLDILINNAGAMLAMPITDLNIAEAKKTFDLNVWACIAMIQAFMPLLLKSSKAIIVNHTSVAAGVVVPFQATYNASKAAMSMYSDSLRVELEPFKIAVVQLKTGFVKTNFLQNAKDQDARLPANSIYNPAREQAENTIRYESASGAGGQTAEQWARGVTADLLKKSPPPIIRRGSMAVAACAIAAAPSPWFDIYARRINGLDKIGKTIQTIKD